MISDNLGTFPELLFFVCIIRLLSFDFLHISVLNFLMYRETAKTAVGKTLLRSINIKGVKTLSKVLARSESITLAQSFINIRNRLTLTL